MEYIPEVKTNLLKFLKESNKDILVKVLEISSNSYYNNNFIFFDDWKF